MNTISKWTMALTLVSGAVYAQQPPDVVVSDGNGNTAMGSGVLSSLTTGVENTAAGDFSMGYSPTGSYNTAFGYFTLASNTASNYNTAIGWYALWTVNTGSYNTAIGAAALRNNGSGSNNTATGYQTLYYTIGGSDNTATGHNALKNNTGSDNVAMGSFALSNSSSGGNNIGLGYKAGYNVTTGSNNVEISNQGASGDNNTIKIGEAGTQTTTFIAGIYDTSVSGSAVMVNSSGQLGVVVSSERFKTGIEPMGSNTARLGRLRPVTFKLKSDAKGTRQYGLIAEEVAKVYPELVIRDANGRIDGVRYDELAPMLLNEMQKEQATIAAQNQKIASLEQQLAGIQAALVKLQSKDELVAQR
jgi:hypothetical protein